MITYKTLGVVFFKRNNKTLVSQSMNPILDEMFSPPLTVWFAEVQTTFPLNKGVGMLYNVEV